MAFEQLKNGNTSFPGMGPFVAAFGQRCVVQLVLMIIIIFFSFFLPHAKQHP